MVRQAARLGLGGVGDLASALFARERERALREDAVVLQLAIERSLAEGLAQLPPLVSRENRLVLSLIRNAAPHELAFEAVVRLWNRRVEILLQMLFDRGAVVRRNELGGDELLSQTRFANSLETEATQVQLHLSTHETSTFFRWSTDGAPTSFWSTVFVERRNLLVKRRRTARVPTLVTTLDHSVDRLASTIAIVLLRVRDVHVEHEKIGVRAVAMQNAAIARDVEDDFAVANHFFQHLGVGEIPRDAVVDVEHEMQNLLAPRFFDCRVELRAHVRALGAFLKWLRLDEDEARFFGVFALLAFLCIERNAVLLLSIADAADDHRAVVSVVPPLRPASLDSLLRASHFSFPRSSRHRFKMRNTSTMSRKSSSDNGRETSRREIASHSGDSPRGISGVDSSRTNIGELPRRSIAPFRAVIFAPRSTAARSPMNAIFVLHSPGRVVPCTKDV
ncbi:MAG: hypothetical protein ABI183_05770 [Polyangiaceae bacterium]